MRAYDKVASDKYYHAWLIGMYSIILLKLVGVLVAVFMTFEYPQKSINSLGLTLEIIGVIFASYLIIFPRNSAKNVTPTSVPLEYIMGGSPSKDKEYERKHSNKMILGVLLIIYGFIVQIISNWV